MKFKRAAVLAVGGVLAFGSASVMAANCSYAYVGGATSQYLNTTNVSLNSADSDDCAGHYSLGNASLATAVTYANTNSLFGGAGWLGAAKQDGTSSESNIFSGLQFQIVGGAGIYTNTFSGSFTINVTDTNGAAAANLPATMDFAIMLSKGQDENDFYFFDNEIVNTSNPGQFQVAFRNPNNNNFQALSHIDLLVRDITSGCAPTDPRCSPTRVPEPGSLALVGIAMFGASRVMRRRA